MEKIIATMVKKNVNGIKISHREREERNGLTRGYKAVYLKNGRLVDLVDLRIAFSTGGAAYACVWLYVPGEFTGNEMGGIWSNGSGTASGYGYHKGSAAAESAFRSAGIRFSESIDGRGWDAVQCAVQACGEMIVKNSCPVYVVEMYA